MSTLFLLVASLVATGYGVVTLYLARAKSDGEAEGFALTGAIALFGGVVGLLMHMATAYGPSLRAYYNEHLPWWLGTVAVLLVYVGRHAGHLTRTDHPWADGRPNEDGRKGSAVRRHIWIVATVALVLFTITALDSSATHQTGWYDALQWVAILVIFSALSIYQIWVDPWILYQRAGTFDPSEHGDIHQWLGAIRKAHRVPNFHLRVQEGEMVHAMAARGLRHHFIVLSRGLLERLPAEHVKAILAHEISHIVHGDTMRRAVPLVLLSGCLNLLYFKFVVLPIDNTWIGLPCVAVGVPFFMIILPGIFQRRWENQADRKAVELMGNAEVVAQSLIRFYNANNVRMDAFGWPHPSLRVRLKAIRRLHAANGVDQRR